ncbi:type II toxin-antitoxin system RelE family toxin [Rhodocyclaceae bacterium SMB388]
MSYKLKFKDEALKEWHKLDATVRAQFKKKLGERLEHPRVSAARLAGHPDRFKIKLRSAGFRLVYEVRDAEIVVVVIAVGKRERSDVYRTAARR